MTVELSSGPGTARFTSTRYFCTVNGSPNYVVQWDTILKNPYTCIGAFNDAMAKCITRWGADESVELVVSMLIGGPVTSYEIHYPEADIVATIVGGALRVQVPAGRQFYLVLNGNYHHPLFVQATPLQPATPPGSVSWPTLVASLGGSTALVPDDVKVHFPAGEWTIGGGPGSPMLVGERVTITLHRDAMLEGGLYLGTGDDVQLIGTGGLHQEGVDPEPISSDLAAGIITYEDAALYSNFTTIGGAYYATKNLMRGWYTFASPFHFAIGGLSLIEDALFVAYSRGGIGDGPGLRPDRDTNAPFMRRTLVYAGDDAAFLQDYVGAVTYEDCVIGTELNSCFNAGYWYGDRSQQKTVTRCRAFHLGLADNNTDVGYPSLGDQTIVASRVDTPEALAQQGWGHGPVTFNDLRVSGRIRSRFLFLRNEPYPYDSPFLDDTYDVAGNVSGIVFNGVQCQYAPEQISILHGRDIANCPNTVHLNDVYFAGELIEQHNVRSWFDLNSNAYRIYVRGFPVALPEDVANAALARIAVHRRVASLAAPAAGSEAEVLAAALDASVDALLAKHPWDFATTRVALTAAANDREDWQQCYLVPDGLLRCLHLLRPDAPHDYPEHLSQADSDYAIELNEDGERRLYCNLEDAHLRYVKAIHDPTMWSPLFRLAVEWKLAAQAAGSLIGGDAGKQTAELALSLSEMFAARGARCDFKMRRRQPDYVPSWIAARL